jgi:hypothetical protein
MARPDTSPAGEAAWPNGLSAPRRPLPLSLRLEIGERDGWVCGICLDREWEHLVVRPGLGVRGPLSAAVDHIMPRHKGGTDDPANLQPAHGFCNGLKHDRGSPDPAYAKARLRWKLYGTPVPGRLWLRHYPGARADRPKGDQSATAADSLDPSGPPSGSRALSAGAHSNHAPATCMASPPTYGAVAGRTEIPLILKRQGGRRSGHVPSYIWAFSAVGVSDEHLRSTSAC